jgi:hypothetical protein
MSKSCLSKKLVTAWTIPGRSAHVRVRTPKAVLSPPVVRIESAAGSVAESIADITLLVDKSYPSDILV